MCSSSLAITWARPVWCWTRLRGNLSKGRRSRRTGGAESDYRPERWAGFREDYRFTGKEDDVEVGLVYFGKRFLSTSLNRWMSADPLEVHAPGEADPNLYAYVRGQLLRAVDPLGLNDKQILKDLNKEFAEHQRDYESFVDAKSEEVNELTAERSAARTELAKESWAMRESGAQTRAD